MRKDTEYLLVYNDGIVGGKTILSIEQRIRDACSRYYRAHMRNPNVCYVHFGQYAEVDGISVRESELVQIDHFLVGEEGNGKLRGHRQEIGGSGTATTTKNVRERPGKSSKGQKRKKR